MRFSNRLSACGLLLVGLLLAVGNLWFTAARSTIPLGLHAKIAQLAICNEKHPGFDDVFFLVLDEGRQLHVDEPVFRGVEVGDAIEKRPFERSLAIQHPTGNHATLQLLPSPDYRSMQWVMPIAVGVAIALTIIAWQSLGRREDRG